MIWFCGIWIMLIAKWFDSDGICTAGFYWLTKLDGGFYQIMFLNVQELGCQLWLYSSAHLGKLYCSLQVVKSTVAVMSRINNEMQYKQDNVICTNRTQANI